MGTARAGAIRRVVSTRIPTRWGTFDVIGFERDVRNGSRRVETALAIVLGDLTEDAPLLRIQSQCFTGEVLGSRRCDCSEQLELAMRAMAREGRGLVVYEQQEGRGIGLMAKLFAYAMQDAGLDTVDANLALGFEADCRDFSLPAAILHALGIRRVRLLSNNPRKTRALRDAGIEVVAELPCEASPTPESLAYLRAKKERLGHRLTLGAFESVDAPSLVVQESGDRPRPRICYMRRQTQPLSLDSSARIGSTPPPSSTANSPGTSGTAFSAGSSPRANAKMPLLYSGPPKLRPRIRRIRG